MRKNNQSGVTTPAIIVITTSAIIILYAILFVLVKQLEYSTRQVALEQSLNIAEAGVNYYRWHLAHDPDDYQDGTGSPGPYEHEYIDPEGSPIGRFSLEITPPDSGSSVVTIQSTGWSYDFPNIKRVVRVQYGQPSFARYSFLQHESSWYGSGITVNGLIHSNNGIRMDGTNLSLVNSAQETYVCGSETGCYNQSYCSSPCNWNSSQDRCECPGVWGSGGDDGLWQYPETQVDFDAISFDFVQMRTAAQNEGVYLEDSESRGYHVVLNGDSFNIYRVNSTDYYYAYGEDGCQRRHQVVDSETLINTYDINDNHIVFAENDLWVEGNLDGRLTIVAARFPIETSQANIWIPDNITYTNYDNTNSLGIIAQQDIYFARNIPEDFKIDAALMAQKGRIMRHAYYSWCGGTSQAVKDKLTLYGSVISYLKSYWNYSGGWGSSGFIERDIIYDPSLLYFSPPYFPSSGEYEFISWQEEND